MKLISHRGNINGPNTQRENTPLYIDEAISIGYDVEVDIYYYKDAFYLGHDEPTIEISVEWMHERKDMLWFHCKNLEAATQLCSLKNNYKFFCHSVDLYVLTSTNNIWVHDLTMKLNNNCIIPLLSDVEIKKFKNRFVYAICTDYIILAKDYN